MSKKSKVVNSKAEGKVGKKSSQPKEVRLVRPENVESCLKKGWRKIKGRYDAGDRQLQAGLEEGTLIALER